MVLVVVGALLSALGCASALATWLWILGGDRAAGAGFAFLAAVFFALAAWAFRRASPKPALTLLALANGVSALVCAGVAVVYSAL